ncbi:glycosyl transferase family 9 [Desulfovibrio sp. X2]|uniref:glycosyltransferase family 9 protein n=1 Tax=Desulfovibrio sp. X2 TaxID=941449 RepID=UPI000358EF39|nr:glycosyltransferase family 9 protein [Desulfovibrio sp. X2]EPR42795.1 glycosyl transferase family 9 [Desulfovibrio sp. X2]
MSPADETHDFDAVVVRLGALGDVALTTGVLAWWGRSRNMRFGVITRERFAPLFNGHPAVSRVIALDEAKMQSGWLTMANALAREFGNLPLVDLHANGRTLLLASMWHGKYRKYPKFSLQRRLFRLFRFRAAGKRLLSCTVPQRYALALDDTPPPAGEVLPVITVSEEERAQARAFLREEGLSRPDRPLVALHPYATHPNKAWPEARWIELAGLLEAADVDYVVVGVNRTRFMADEAGPRDLTNASSLRATCALLAEADVCVTGDSGPMHLASGVGTPVVALFGPTTRHWGFFPSGPRDTVLERPLRCRPCDVHGGSTCRKGQECLKTIAATEVMDAVMRLVANVPSL